MPGDYSMCPGKGSRAMRETGHFQQEDNTCKPGAGALSPGAGALSPGAVHRSALHLSSSHTGLGKSGVSGGIGGANMGRLDTLEGLEVLWVYRD